MLAALPAPIRPFLAFAASRTKSTVTLSWLLDCDRTLTFDAPTAPHRRGPTKMSRSLPRLGLLAAIATFACTDATTSPNARPSLAGKATLNVAAADAPSYILLASGNSLRDGLVADVEAAGGTVVSSIGEIGVVVATSADPNFAKKAKAISGISDAVPDVTVQWTEPTVGGEVEATEAAVDAQTHGPTGYGSHDSFRLVQWAPDAIEAPAAWDAGYRGAGARVAILDGGIYTSHVDLAGKVDMGASRSFAKSGNTLTPFNSDVGTFWHGTHVAGIVAASANGIGTVGIAPEATIIGVKVLHAGSGQFAWIIDGIMYAARPIGHPDGGAGADIINMSIGVIGGFLRQGAGNAQLAAAVSRATMYAVQRGVTVIASAGNDATDIDHTANRIFIPGQSTGVITVSALGPMGWATGAAFDLDRRASYTNFGQSAINLAGPGGDSALPGTAFCSKPRIGSAVPLTNFCWVFDMVLAPSRGAAASTTSYSWANGTSMSSPAVAGVAALIVGKAKSEGVKITPSQVRTKLEKSADDLGKPGNDDTYGAGRVNARRAVE